MADINWKKEIKGADELVRCKKCGKEIWKYWYVENKRSVRQPYIEMDICAPCLFKIK